MSLTDWLRSLRAILAVGLGMYAFVIAVSAMLPGAPYFADNAAFPAFVAVLPLFGSIVIEGAAKRRRSRSPSVGSYGPATPERLAAPPFASWTLGQRMVAAGIVRATTAAMICCALSGFLGDKGQPEQHGARYYADNHGVLKSLAATRRVSSAHLVEHHDGGRFG